MQNFDGLELRPGLAPGCPLYKGGLALPRVAQRESGVIDRFRPGTHWFTASDADHYTTITTGTTDANCRRADRCRKAAAVCSVVLVVRVGFAPTTFPL